MSSLLQAHAGKDGFRLRGLEMSRIDGFSDVVFGFALTLLVVSLEVPKTFPELHEMMRGFLPFAISFVLLMTIWWEHYLFFRRYGLHDARTIMLNAVLLFTVLFYVYPLKFLFSIMVSEMLGVESVKPFTDQHQVVELMVIYGLGFAAIYLLFAGLYWNAWRQREHLDLNPIEAVLARMYILNNLSMAAIGLFSCLLAVVLPESQAGHAGFVYMLIGASKTLFGFYEGRKVRSERARLAALPEPEC